MLKYGRGSRHSGSQNLEDICRDLHCQRERYTWTSHPALEGTNCGEELVGHVLPITEKHFCHNCCSRLA